MFFFTSFRMTETQKCLEHSDAKYTIYGTPAPFAHPHCAEKTLPFIISFDSVSYHTLVTVSTYYTIALLLGDCATIDQIAPTIDHIALLYGVDCPTIRGFTIGCKFGVLQCRLFYSCNR